jgi:hypothetical protein
MAHIFIIAHCTKRKHQKRKKKKIVLQTLIIINNITSNQKGVCMLGIKETKELLSFLIKLGHGIDKASADGWSITDLVHFAPALQAVFAGVAGIDQVDDELFDLDDEERQALVDFVKEDLDLTNDEAEAAFEDGIRLGFDLWNFVKRFIKKEIPEEPVE